MTAFTAKVAAALDAGKALTTTLLNQLWDNTTYAKERLDAHTHDGTDSSLIPIGANLLRNGSFENGSVGWTASAPPVGSSISITTTAGNFCDGIAALQFVASGALTNGSGYWESNEYIAISGGVSQSVSAMIKASVLNIASQLEIIWYATIGGASLSASTVYSGTATTAFTVVGGQAVAPSTARYMRIRLTGVTTATATNGTVCMDGVVARSDLMQAAGNNFGGDLLSITSAIGLATHSTTSLGAVEGFNARIPESGIYRVSFRLTPSAGGGAASNAQIYKNGVAYGIARQNIATIPGIIYVEDLSFNLNDTVQIFNFAGPSRTSIVSEFKLGNISGSKFPIAYPVGAR